MDEDDVQENFDKIFEILHEIQEQMSDFEDRMCRNFIELLDENE